MIATQKSWIQRVSRLIGFMNYSWKDDEKWLSYCSSKSTKKAVADEKAKNTEEEGMKRAYYGSQVDKEFEQNFEFENETKRSEYFEYCSLYSGFGTTSRKSSARRFKQIFYFLFLLALPLRIPYTPVFFLVAAVFSIFEKKMVYGNTAGNLLTRVFTDEEPMNLALLLMLLFSSPFVKMILYICLLIWAFLMWCEWGQELLE